MNPNFFLNLPAIMSVFSDSPWAKVPMFFVYYKLYCPAYETVSLWSLVLLWTTSSAFSLNLRAKVSSCLSKIFIPENWQILHLSPLLIFLAGTGLLVFIHLKARNSASSPHRGLAAWTKIGKYSKLFLIRKPGLDFLVYPESASTRLLI